MKVALANSFQYVHEPLRRDEAALKLLGNAGLIGELRSRIAHSHGGAFLITGFRGVGKSTLVLRTLDELAGTVRPGWVVVPVVLSVARSTSTDRLLFAVIRRIFETLNALGYLHSLPAEIRHSLLLAYIRTSLSFKETQNNAAEQAAGLELGLGAGTPVVRLPKLSMSMKRSRSLATEASFLAYSETDVEYDLTRIISLLDEDRPAPARSRIRRLVRRARTGVPRLHLVIVLDEVDKLTAGAAGLAAVEELLAGIKNVLTSTGAHFLLVAGTDMHDRAVKDVSRGNSVYESVFAWRMYVPCLWEAPKELLTRLVGAGDEENAAVLAQFTDYLKFKARGVTRRLLQEFNSFVVWEHERPYLRIDEADRDRIAFYARLESILADHFAQSPRTKLFPLAVDNDRRRLGIYYIMDAILRTVRPFSSADLLAGNQEMDLDPLLRMPESSVERLLDHLAANRILDVVHRMDSSDVVIEDVAGAQKTVYQLADDVLAAMHDIAVHSEVERAALDLSIVSAPSVDSYERTRPPSGRAQVWRRVKRPMADRYELVEMLGQGGMGQVFRGYDRLFDRHVAIKILPAALLDNDQAVTRFRREADIAVRARHPQIVRTFDVVQDPELGLGLVMELLSGQTLRERVETHGPLQVADTLRVGRLLAAALSHLELLKLARLDLKPSNIIMEPLRGPVIIDFGIARQLETDTRITDDRTFVGTPQYMAPEQVAADRPIDIRADIYALGQVLYFSLMGRTPWHTDSMPVLIHRLVNEEVGLVELPISPEFRAVLARALARSPEARFQHAVDLAAALDELPDIDYLADERTLIAQDLAVTRHDLYETAQDYEGCPVCGSARNGRICATCGHDFGETGSR